MYQAYDRPKTPTRFNNSQQAKTIETSPFKNGKPNNKYANPSMVSNDVFYEKHYDNPQKQLTPSQLPLGIPTKGYGKMNDYKDRYKQMSGQPDSKGRTPVRSEMGNEREEVRSNLRDSYIQKTRESGDATPTRSQQGGRFEGQRNPEYGARTPTRRTDPNLNELRATGQRSPSDYQNTRNLF